MAGKEMEYDHSQVMVEAVEHMANVMVRDGCLAVAVDNDGKIAGQP